MTMYFTHSVGYRGLCAIKGGKGNSGASKAEMNKLVPVLCTGGNVSLGQDPIMSSGVWGAGYANIAPVAYAYNYLNLEGSSNFELTLGENLRVWRELRKMAFTGRTNGDNTILLYPDGINGFYNFGWLSSLGFDASEGSALTGNFNFKGDPGVSSDSSAINCNNYHGGVTTVTPITDSYTGALKGDGHPASSEHLNTGWWEDEINPVGLVGGVLVPYWNTYVKCNGTSVGDVISWSCSYNSDLQFLKCCNARPSDADAYYPIAADYIMCGEMTCDGSMTIFGLREISANGSVFAGFSAKALHSVKVLLKFVIGGQSVTVPKALLSSASTSMATGASYISAEYSFTGLGDGIHSIMDMSDPGDDPDDPPEPPDPEEP